MGLPNLPSFWEILKNTAELIQQGVPNNSSTCKLWQCVCNNSISFQARFCCPPNIVLRPFPPTFASLLWKLFVCCNSQVLPTPSSWHLLLAFLNISKCQSVTNCHCQSKSINSVRLVLTMYKIFEFSLSLDIVNHQSPNCFSQCLRQILCDLPFIHVQLISCINSSQSMITSTAKLYLRFNININNDIWFCGVRGLKTRRLRPMALTLLCSLVSPTWLHRSLRCQLSPRSASIIWRLFLSQLTHWLDLKIRWALVWQDQWAGCTWPSPSQWSPHKLWWALGPMTAPPRSSAWRPSMSPWSPGRRAPPGDSSPPWRRLPRWRPAPY